MVKALTFKGDPKPSKKRKRTHDPDSTTTLSTTNHASQPHSAKEREDGENEDDTAWVSAEKVSDISGPILLLLTPTNTDTNTDTDTDALHTCLATDSMGKIHASPLENIIASAPSPHHTAEPHLVSQVWIATRVVGSEAEFTFKGHHGRFLGCDAYGFWEAGREAVGREEAFTCEEVKAEKGDGEGGAREEEDDGVFALRTAKGTYLSVRHDKNGGGAPEIRGDAEDINASARIRIRMQAKFKPRLRVEKAEKVRAKISRRELEAEVGRRLEEDEVRMLKRARREGNYHEAVLDVKVKGKHDKFA